MGQIYGLCQPRAVSLIQNFQMRLVFPERYLGRTCLKDTFLKRKADAKTTGIIGVSKLTEKEIERGRGKRITTRLGLHFLTSQLKNCSMPDKSQLEGEVPNSQDSKGNILGCV